jgi:hypothetical protein
MKFDTQAGYAFMHLYLSLHPKKSPAYDPTEEGYISDVEESRLHHFAEFIRFNERVRAQQQSLRAETESQGAGWQDFTQHFMENVHGDIEFDDKELAAAFEKFKADVHRICSRPHTQLEIEIAKSLE